MCASDSLALGAMMAVREAGLTHFPVMGFDNTPVAQAVGLSSVDQRLGLVAQGTLELLMGATGPRVLPHGTGTDDPRHRLITPQLVVRRSSHLAPVEEAGGTSPAIANERKRAHEEEESSRRTCRGRRRSKPGRLQWIGVRRRWLDAKQHCAAEHPHRLERRRRDDRRQERGRPGPTTRASRRP